MSKEFLSSLPEVMDHYSQCNLLLPTSTDVQLNPFYKFHVEEVPVDLGENSGDIFKVGSVDSGKKDRSGNTIWVSAFSLTKPMLNKLAMAAGIQFNPKETYGERIDKYTYRAQAQGAMKVLFSTMQLIFTIFHLIQHRKQEIWEKRNTGKCCSGQKKNI